MSDTEIPASALNVNFNASTIEIRHVRGTTPFFWVRTSNGLHGWVVAKDREDLILMHAMASAAKLTNKPLQFNYSVHDPGHQGGQGMFLVTAMEF